METEAPARVALANDIVLNAHGNLDRVKELLQDDPKLVNASWDWGDGDWETPLGAAAHMGRRDIALYLLDHGANLDLFAAAMLGELDIVRAIVQRFPSMRDAKGPHGIPLLVHAEKGGPDAAAVFAFLAEPQ